jgi:hypothetical protein
MESAKYAILANSEKERIWAGYGLLKQDEELSAG